MGLPVFIPYCIIIVCVSDQSFVVGRCAARALFATGEFVHVPGLFSRDPRNRRQNSVPVAATCVELPSFRRC